MKKILLIGFRGTGKSSVGRALANFLGYSFIDTDEEIERRAESSISDIVTTKGWDYFRKMERDVLKELEGKGQIVCSLGGGAILHEVEMERLKRESLIIWLDADLNVIKKRIAEDEKTLTKRPPLTDLAFEEELKEVYNARKPLYAKWAQLRIDTTQKSIPEIIEEINTFLEKEVNYVKHCS